MMVFDESVHGQERQQNNPVDQEALAAAEIRKAMSKDPEGLDALAAEQVQTADEMHSVEPQNPLNNDLVDGGESVDVAHFTLGDGPIVGSGGSGL